MAVLGKEKKVWRSAGRVDSGKTLSRSLVGDDVYETVLLVELNLARRKGKEGKILTQTYVLPRVVFGSALAQNDVSRQDGFPAEFLDPEPLAVAVPAVFGSTLSFFVCHVRISLELLQVNGLDFDN